MPTRQNSQQPTMPKRRREGKTGLRRWRHIAAIGAAAFVWGLGLARFIAEAAFCAPLYSAVAPVVGLAALCSLLLIEGGACSRFLPVLSTSTATFASFWIPLLFPTPYVMGLFSQVFPMAGGVLLAGGLALTTLTALDAGRRRHHHQTPRPPQPSQNERRLAGISWAPMACLILTTLALYLSTLLPSLGTLDTFEFQVVVPRLGVAHPTGYPLYVLLGKLFTFLPVGDVAWRVNFSSAVFATGAAVILYLILRRLTTSWAGIDGLRWLPALAAALALACSFTFWSQAIVAEVYALHNLLVALILWLLLALPQDLGPFALTPARRWQATFFLLGLSLTNHLTTALLVPAAALALLWDRPRLRVVDWAKALGLGILGFSLYLFVWLRWPAVNQGAWMTPSAFLTYITGGQFHGALRFDGWRDPTRWEIVARLLRQPFGWAGLALAALGLLGLALRRRRALALTGVTFLAFGLYGLLYYVPDISVFLLPAHLILALWIGVGIALAAEFLSRRHGMGAAVVLAALLPLRLIWTNYAALDQSREQGRIAWGRYVLDLPLAPGSTILADIDKFAPLYYLQQIEGLRPDLDLLLFHQESSYHAALAERLAGGQTVYLARYLPNLGGLPMRSMGPLVEVGAAGVGQAGEPMARFGGRIALLGVNLTADPFGRRMHHLTLRWLAEEPVADDLLVRVRLLDAGGVARWASDGVRPVGGLYPSNAWPASNAADGGQAGETYPIDDYHAVEPPLWLPTGTYRVEVGLFPRFDDVGLGVDGGDEVWFSIGSVTVTQPEETPALAHWRRCAFSADDAASGWLTGYDLASETSAGVPYTVDLAWRRRTATENLQIVWVNERANERGMVSRSARFSLESDVVRSRHTITAPQTSGNYALYVEVTGELVRSRWLARPEALCPLASVQVLPARRGLANFANLILLLDAEIELPTAQLGAVLPVSLQWQALRAIDADYTVFVHLVGPDGRLWGQEDVWPVQGSYPTGQWRGTEKIHDPHRVFIEPTAPPGAYQVHVGWYLLETMQRLPVLDQDGSAVGDTFVIGAFQVIE